MSFLTARGHTNGDITTHHSEPELMELLDAVNSVLEAQPGKNRAERNYRMNRNSPPAWTIRYSLLTPESPMAEDYNINLLYEVIHGYT